MATAAPASRPASLTTRLLLGGALLTAIPIWWWLAVPVITLSAATRHAGHFAMVFVHMLGGTVMLFVGAANLYIGQTRRFAAWHRPLGLTYVVIGGVGGVTGLTLSILNAHRNAGVAYATGSLACAWMAVTALAWRAAMHRRIDAHRELMIRSYVLTWSFVACRTVGRLPGGDAFGDASGSTAVWLTWIVPLMLSEIVLQWRKTGAR